MERLGFGYAELSRINPRIICAYGTGYGLTGPDRDTLGQDMMLLGFPVKLSDTPAALASAPPLLGEHNREILGSLLGLNDRDIDRLEQEKVV